jgi:predicted esterase
MKIIKRFIVFIMVFLFAMPLTKMIGQEPSNYTLIIEGLDWGPAAKKVVLPVSQSTTEVDKINYEVKVSRKADGVLMSPAEAGGNLQVVHAYISDSDGNRISGEGNHITLVLYAGPNQIIDNPIKYVFQNGSGSNRWIDFNLTIMDKTTRMIWNKESRRIIPLVDRFDLSGKYLHSDGTKLTYASYAPAIDSDKKPLIIWLHGGGEGGTDTSIPLVANRAANYASDDIQKYFGGAYVLVPQAPTFWMQNANGQYTRGDVEDIYHKSLMGLIRKYVADNVDIDQDRIYIGGCSNGGYMSLKLIMLYPDYFAAGYISALAYHNKFITDDQISKIKNVPMWFVHSKDDKTTKPDETVVPLYHRLIDAGAGNVHFSYYDHVYDITGLYGGKDYWYYGHFSWIYSHANHADFDFDGKRVEVDRKPVTIMEWMAVQKR